MSSAVGASCVERPRGFDRGSDRVHFKADPPRRGRDRKGGAEMITMKTNSGWLGTGDVVLARLVGPAIAVARPRHEQGVVFDDPTGNPRSGVRQLA